jgi:hypothetical protein
MQQPAVARLRVPLRPDGQRSTFELGDFVLVARRERPAGEKRTLRWCSPMRIVSTLSEHVYEVRSLDTESVQAIHATRLRFYHDPSLNITADLIAQIAHNNQGYAVRALRSLR